jgi:hypothetical protein
MRHMGHAYARLITTALMLVSTSAALADGAVDLAVDSAQTRLAIVTGKEGLASGLAHRHIIVARNVVGRIKVTGSPALSAVTIKSAVADIEFAVDQMAVDLEEEAKSIIPSLVSAGVWDQGKDKIEPSNSEKVRENMLAESQLDAKKFSKISGHGELSACQAVSSSEARCSLALTFAIKGGAVKRDLQVKLTGAGKSLEASFVVPMKFTDFGIKPYSAMMGAIRVSDEMFISGMIKSTP